MREILFRGKRTDNREWVYGYYVRNAHFDKLEHGGHLIFNINDKKIYQVIPETVGQYIGIKDKASKKIFEGDKVKQSFFGDEIIGVVVYDPNEAKFGVYEKEEDYYTEIVKDTIEVINDN